MLPPDVQLLYLQLRLYLYATSCLLLEVDTPRKMVVCLP
jgi:hypothetical protein